MKDYTVIKQICILVIIYCIGVLVGLNLQDSKPTKHYPIEVRCHWETSQSSYYPTMEADSVNGDTIWKDNNKIVNKNIRNIEFK